MEDSSSGLARVRVNSSVSPVDAPLTESQLRDVFNSLPNLAWTCLADGYCDYLSRQWVAYTGVPEREQVGYGWLNQIHPDDRERVKAAWSGAVGREVGYDVEFRIRRADGVYRWFRALAIPLRDASGKVIKWYGSNSDVDDYKRSEEALRQSEERFRQAITTAPIPIIIHDENDNILAMSAGWTELSGYTLEDIPTISDWAEKAYGERQALVKDYIDQLFEIERTVSNGAWTIKTKHGSTREWEFFTSPLRQARNAPRLLMSTAVDLTERNRAERAVKRLNEELERRVEERTGQLTASNRELEAFSYSVAHDLRSPLRGMSGFAQVLLDEYSGHLDADGVDCLREIHSNAAKMGQLIDALLSLSRLTRSEIRPERVDLSELAASIAADPSAAHGGRQVEFVIDPNLEAALDPQLARILLENLLGNAWKFTEHSPAPRIVFAKLAGATPTTFLVRDNGAGFDMAYVHKLFAPFQRLHSSSEYSGTGVGLATVQRIVHRHGGTIWAEGRVGGGASFYFTVGSPQGKPA